MKTTTKRPERAYFKKSHAHVDEKREQKRTDRKAKHRVMYK